MSDAAGEVTLPSVPVLLERYENRVTGGQTVLVAGERGVGKTTLVGQFRARVSRQEPAPLVATGSCGPGLQPPYEPFRQAFAAFPAGCRPPGLTGATRALAPAGPDEAAGRRQSLFTDIRDQLVAVAADRPVVLVLEDLHWADSATLALFEFLVDAVEEVEQPVVLVGTYRPGAVERLQDIERAAGEHIQLEPFDEDRVGTVLARRIGVETVPRPLARAVHEHTGGVALFVTQLGELLAARLGPDGTLPETLADRSLPETIEGAIAERFETLPPEVASLLRLGAVAGESVGVELLCAASERGRAETERCVDALVDRRVWTCSEGRVSFVHRALREVALDLDGEPAERLHSRIAAAIETAHADEPHRHAGRLGTHYEAAGADTRALEWYREAGDHARRRYAHGEAIDHYRRALELAADGRPRTALRADLAAVYNAVGDFESALEVTRDTATDRPDPAGADGDGRAVCRLLGERSRAQLEQGDHDGARETLERERDLVAELNAPTLEAQVLGRCGELARRQSEYDLARDRLRTAIQLAREAGDRRTIASLSRKLGTAAYHTGEYERARECYVDALEHNRELDDRLAESWCLNNLGMVAWRQGSSDRAREFYEESLAVKRELGDQQGEAQTLGNLGLVARTQGEYDLAREFYEESLAIKREIGDRPGVATTLSNLGVAVRRQGEYGQARACYEESLTIAREVGDRQLTAMALNNLGELASNRSEYDQAREFYEESLAIKREIGDQRSEATTLNNLAVLAHRQGRDDRAHECASRSLDIRREAGTRRDKAESLDVLGAVACARGDHNLAREHHERSLSIKRDTESRTGLVRTLLQGSRIARERGDHERARRVLGEAGSVLEQLSGEELLRPRYALESAQLALATGDTGRAREQATAAREAFEAAGSDHWAGRARWVLGRVAAEEGRTDQARGRWQEALATVQTVGAPQDALDILREWVGFERGLENRGRADRLREQARGLLDDAPVPVAARHRGWVKTTEGG